MNTSTHHPAPARGHHSGPDTLGGSDTPGEPDALRSIRNEIDRVDQEILDLLAQRLRCAQATLGVKAQHGLAAEDNQREAAVVRRAAGLARERGLEPELVRDIYWRLIALSKAAR